MTTLNQDLAIAEGTLIAIAAAVMTKKASFRIGSFTASISVDGGAPVHFTIGQAMIAAAMIESGAPGSVEIGDVIITVTKNS